MAKSKLIVTTILVVGLTGNVASAQHLSSSRGIGIGSYTSMVNDLSALDWNPAGLVHVRDWELSGTNFSWVGPSTGSNGLVFQSTGATKSFMELHSAAMRYSPAISMEFVVPSIFTLVGSGQTISFDKRIQYHERYALGYAYRTSPTVSLGVSARYVQEQVTDTEPFFEQDTIARIRTHDYNAAAWNLDFGLLWEPEPEWRVGVVAKNLFKIQESEFPQDIRQFALRTTKTLRAGLAYSPSQPLWLSFDLDIDKQGAAGLEWNVAENLYLRQGTYFGRASGSFFHALSAGIGWNYEAARFDISYLHFLDQESRTNVSFNNFVSDGVKDIGFNQFSPSQLSLSVNVALGHTKESFARIEHVEILDEVYPASYQVHAWRPLGEAIVRNTSKTAIQARVGFFAGRFMDSPTLTDPQYIAPNSSRKISFYAVFNEAIRSVSSMILQVGDVFVKAAPASDYDDKVSTSLIIRGRNDWDGNVISLRSFVTPGDPDILGYTRSVLSKNKDSLANVVKELEHFRSASLLFNEFAGRLVYVNDPQSSKDRVQFPSETLSLRGGDCDDITVSFATILSSIGVATAFVDVIPPTRPQEGHIYMLFDTGLKASQAGLISTNEKRYVVRKNGSGQETVWIPIETTAVNNGFQRAWELGAKEYYDDVQVGLGVVRGWVRVVDVLPTME